MRDPEEPARDRTAPTDRPGPVGQDEKHGLKGILGLVRIVENALTDAAHHRPMPGHQLLEGRLRGLIALRDESV